MRKVHLYCLYIVATLWGGLSYAEPVKSIAPTLNGIEFPVGYENWQTISVSHRIDNNSIRTILGDPIAIQAARNGKTNPWPEGAILAKVAWKQRIDENWPSAIVPGEFHQVEFMIKDAKKYSATKGWGYARWRGKDLIPWGDNADFAQGCVACHTPVANKDYVFSTPAIFINGK
jgi:hypothetical protein